MKKYYLILLPLIAFGWTSRAQNFDWAKSFGGSLDNQGKSSTLDASGNVYSTGYFQGTVDFDPGAGTANLTSAGNRDIFIQKLDASGNFLWAKSFGGSAVDEGASITVDASGNIYITGYFYLTADLDPGTGTANHTTIGGSDVFVQKLDASGNFLWARSFGGSLHDVGKSITVDALGNVYTTGFFESTVDFDPGAGTANHTATGSSDLFIQKLDASGNFLWVKTFGGNSGESAMSLAVDTLGNVYTTGYFGGTVDFDPGVGTSNLSSAGGSDVFVQKLDASGNYVWAKSFGGSQADQGLSIAVDASGNVFTSGYFSGTGDFDPGAATANLSSAGGRDIFVQKLDPSGNYLWAKSFGGSSSDYGQSIALDTLGNVYTTGYFFGTVDFDPGAGTANFTSAGGYEVFVQKLNASGNFLWAQSFGGNQNDQGISIKVDTSGNVYTLGVFQGTGDFDPGAGTANLTSAGSYDIFVQKMSQCTANPGTFVQASCNSYTWIDGNTYTVSNNTATHTLTNAAGCDSVVTLDLTINSVTDLTTSLTGLTITATNSNATYQWLDCDNNHAVINGETNQTFTATTNGNYAVELTENGCIDTSSCVSITTVGIIENGIGYSLLIYPNPTSGKFSIDLGASYENTQVLITDIAGKVIQSKKITQAQNLDLSIENPAGIYFVSIQAGNKSAVITLVKE